MAEYAGSNGENSHTNGDEKVVHVMMLVNRKQVLMHYENSAFETRPAWAKFFKFINLREGFKDWYRIKGAMETIRQEFDARGWFMS